MTDLSQLETPETPETVYKFFSYDSKQSYPSPDNMRLVTCLYRTPSDGSDPKHKNAGIHVPDWITPELVAENMPLLSEHILAWLNTMEDARIKTSYESKSIGFGDSYFSMDMLLSYLEEKNISARLSGEQITEWFTASGLAEALTELYTEKTGSDETAKRIVTFVAKKLVSLASPKTVWSEEEQDKILPLLEAVEDTPIGRRLIQRIKNMAEMEESDLLSAL